MTTACGPERVTFESQGRVWSHKPAGCFVLIIAHAKKTRLLVFASYPLCRLILFLQQSSVEWASSLWLNVVQEVDPTFQRTVSSEWDREGRGACDATAIPQARLD